MPNKKNNSKVNDINQEFKEKEVQEISEKTGIPYINLLNFKINPDVLQLLEEEDSINASLVVFFQIGKKIRVALSDPDNAHAKELIQRFKVENFAVNINLASKESIKKVQDLYKSNLYKKKEDFNIDLEKEEMIASEAIQEFEEEKEKELLKKPAAEALKDIHKLAVQTNASDVHFQPSKDKVEIRFRIDGMLQTISVIDHKAYEGILQQIKMKAHLKLNITAEPQDGQYFIIVNEREIDIRVAIMPSLYSESVALRLLDPKKGIISLKDLGFRKYSLENIANFLSKSEGIIFLAGPTGSGKTTTMYSMLDILNRPYRKIITLEDPVEYKMEGILQCEVQKDNNAEGFSFESGLISILRQDPDVVMIGEIREPVVADIAFQASMTGHLVLSTIHSNSAIDTFSRLKNLKVNDYFLAPAINAIVAQRLARKICSHCKTQKNRKDKDLKYLESILVNLTKKVVKLDPVNLKKEFYGKGCKYCNNTGYFGRTLLTEILVVNEEIEKLIQKQANANVILKQAEKNRFITMKEDAVIKVLDGTTTWKEVLRVLI